MLWFVVENNYLSHLTTTPILIGEEYDGIELTLEFYGINHFKIVYSEVPIEYGLYLFDEQGYKPELVFWQYCPISDFDYFIPNSPVSSSYFSAILWKPYLSNKTNLKTYTLYTVTNPDFLELTYGWWMIPVDENGKEIYRNLLAEPLI